MLKTHERKIRYLVAGAWNTLFGYGAFIVLYRVALALKIHYLFALAAGNVLGTTNNYFSYKHFVFKTAGISFLREYFRFSMVYWVIFAINLFALPALVKVTGLGPVPAQGLILAFTIIAGYLAHSRISFRDPRVAGSSV